MWQKKKTGKRFERLVAALNVWATEGAEVKWDDEIEGRQVDVSIRFRKGFYDYLVVIECKDYAGSVPGEKVEAFAKRLGKLKADKGVMVSRYGFQQGFGTELARDEGIGLYTLEEIDESWPDKVKKETVTIGANVFNVRFVPQPGHRAPEIPDEKKVLPLVRLEIDGFGAPMSLEQALNNLPSLHERELAQPEPFAIHFPQRCILHVPGQRSVPLALMFFMAWKVPVVVREVSRMPPETRKTKLSYADFLTGETTEVDADEIDIGFDTVLEPGGFYRNIRGWVYVCEHVEAGSAHLVLLDSLQHGRIIVVRCTTEQKYQTKYVPITDEEELREWEERYKSFLQAAGPFEKPAA